MLEVQMHKFPRTIIDMIDDWRVVNNNRFGSKEIFREEFLKFIDGLLMEKFHWALNQFVRENCDNHQDEIKQVKELQRDLWYGLEKNTSALAEMAKLICTMNAKTPDVKVPKKK